MTLKHKFEIEINRPLDQVIKLFRNRENLPKWQHGLLSEESLPSKDDYPTYQLTFQLGRRRMKMTETIIRDALPAHYDVRYKMKGVKHSIQNSFFAMGDDKTKWISEVEYRFSGLMNLIARFMKSGFEQQSRALMYSFKTFAEGIGKK